MQQNRQRAGISSEHDELRRSTIQGLCGLVRAFLDLAVVSCLLDEVEDVLGQGLVGDGPGCVEMSVMSFFFVKGW